MNLKDTVHGIETGICAESVLPAETLNKPGNKQFYTPVSSLHPDCTLQADDCTLPEQFGAQACLPCFTALSID